MGEELLPCPFCEGAPEWASRRPFLLHCANTDCLGHHYEQDEQGGYNHSFATEAEAIAAWNTRTPPAPEGEDVEIARLRAIVERAKKIAQYLEIRDNRLLASDGPCRDTLEGCEKALRDVYLLATGQPLEPEG